MANVKISELTAAAALTGAEQVEAVQGGATVRTTTGAIAALIEIVRVTADGTTDVAPTIQAVLDSLAASNSRSHEVIVEPAYPHTPTSTIYLNGKVRITTSNTKVRFRAPVKLGTLIDPDGLGGLSILGTLNGTATVTSGATRGNSVIVVDSTTGITAGTLVQVLDNDATGGQTAGDKSEMAEVVHIDGLNLHLNQALHHTYTGTVTLRHLTPIANSGFEDVDATFVGQQATGTLYTCRARYTRDCYYRNITLRGSATDSWSREAFTTGQSLRTLFDRCTASFPHAYATSGQAYGFVAADGATEVTYRDCLATMCRLGYTATRGACGLIYEGCRADKVMSRGFDIHAGWCRDTIYIGCTATSAPDGLQSGLTERSGFGVGNTTFTTGGQWVMFTGCTARGFTNATGSHGVGFGVQDGSAHVTFRSCSVHDSQRGVQVYSQSGAAITNVGIYDCEFNNISSSDTTNRPPQPITIDSGNLLEDVNGVVIDGCRIVNSPLASPVLIRGKVAKSLANVQIVNNIWNRSEGSGYGIECTYVTGLVVQGNILNGTKRGVRLSECPSALVVQNVLNNLTEPGYCIVDIGGSTNMVFAKNVVRPAPTSLAFASASTGAFIDITAEVGVASASLPTLPAGSTGAQAWDTTNGKPAWWNGTAWVRATVA